MTVKLEVQGARLVGELRLAIAPGTAAAAQDRAITEAVGGPLFDACGGLGVVLAAAPRKYVRPLPGKDEEGRTRFTIGGRIEGGRLVPALEASSSKGLRKGRPKEPNEEAHEESRREPRKR